ncbi:MAG: O-succinylhomoserine sulfhydrylase [Pseudomonadales bacterium]|nr:O-succinylhomoserine sulfhydrylase [Pseudomonadales bacterium]
MSEQSNPDNSPQANRAEGRTSIPGSMFETLAVRAGHNRTHEGEHAEPIFTTSSFIFESAADAAARFKGPEPSNVYSRYTNPTVRNFEERIAALEGAEQAVATASGMSAILSTCMSLLKCGDHVVCSSSLFGTTISLFGNIMQRFGVEVTFVAPTNLAEWQEAVKDNTEMFFLETPSNPLSEIIDLRALAKISRKAGALLVVDNVFCTPALQRPLELGADIVVHSATKYIDGQGRCVGGVVAGKAEHMKELVVFLRTAGPSMSPFNAWVFLKGLETLKLRMDAHCRNAQQLAEWLTQQPQVEKVYYSGLKSHPGHELAKSQQSGFGGVLSFELKGDQETAWRFIDATILCSLTANLGDVKTTIIHPATTTHGRLTDIQRAEAGIKDSLIRVAVGLEDIEDIKSDMMRGFGAV